MDSSGGPAGRAGLRDAGCNRCGAEWAVVSYLHVFGVRDEFHAEPATGLRYEYRESSGAGDGPGSNSYPWHSFETTSPMMLVPVAPFLGDCGQGLFTLIAAGVHSDIPCGIG